MKTYIFTKEEKWLEKWDSFIAENAKGSHLLLSDWLKSYQSYGFDFEVGLILENDKIIGGYGSVVPKFLFFKFYVIPHGPIYDGDSMSHLEAHLLKIKERAMAIGACYLQLSMPMSSNQKIQKHVCQKEVTNILKKILQPGKLFSHVYASYGINWVDLQNFENDESYLEQLTPKVRRNIRMPYNKNAQATFLSDIEEIEQGYNVIRESARQGNYSVREFSDFKSTIDALIKKNQAYFIVLKVEGVIRAAAFFVLASGFITNITGGVLRQKPDIKLGYMLQWEMIKKSFELGLHGYNISMGGSTGVQDYKSKFGAEAIRFEEPHYHLVLRPFYFKLFRMFSTYLKPYKTRISKLLAQFR